MSDGRAIIADHYFKRYFDLGYGIMLPAAVDMLVSEDTAFEFLRINFSIGDYLKAAAKQLCEFTVNVPQWALEIIIEPDANFSTVVNDLDYICSGSRYNLVPTTLRYATRTSRSYTPATDREADKCMEVAVMLYKKRTGITSTAVAFEAVRRTRLLKIG